MIEVTDMLITLIQSLNIVYSITSITVHLINMNSYFEFKKIKEQLVSVFSLLGPTARPVLPFYVNRRKSGVDALT